MSVLASDSNSNLYEEGSHAAVAESACGRFDSLRSLRAGPFGSLKRVHFILANLERIGS